MIEKRKILIVDDRHENLIALEKLLTGLDNTVVIKAFSGNEALEKTLEHDFALALIDVQMPDMDGYETVKLMQNVEKTRFLPVIFISAIYSENQYLIEGIEAGAVDFITKPIIPRILLGKIRVFLELYEQKKILEQEIEQRKITEENLKRAEKELIIAKQKAEEADRLKSEFLANMSHEIRTPLNAIVGFSNLIADEDIETDKKLEYIRYINNSSNSLMQLISDILDLSKIETNQLDLKIGTVSVNELIDELAETFESELKQRAKGDINLRINTNPVDKELLIESDSIRLKQVLANLLGNAIKFTDKGYIEFGYNYNGGDSVTFFVKDTGMGIPKDKLNNVFNRFERVDYEKFQNISGAGLGLAISKSIIQMLKGKIWVESEMGEGTEFYFEIPGGNIKYAIDEDDTETEVEKEIFLDKKKILIAEDEPINYTYLKVVLEPTNAQILWAKNGNEAIEIVNQQAIDLVLMDIKMPVVDGYMAFKEIRQKFPDLPVIAQTAYAMQEEKAKLLDAGFNAYLPKPINSAELIEVITKFLMPVEND